MKLHTKQLQIDMNSAVEAQDDPFKISSKKPRHRRDWNPKE